MRPSRDSRTGSTSVVGFPSRIWQNAAELHEIQEYVVSKLKGINGAIFCKNKLLEMGLINFDLK